MTHAHRDKQKHNGKHGVDVRHKCEIGPCSRIHRIREEENENDVKELLIKCVETTLIIYPN